MFTVLGQWLCCDSDFTPLTVDLSEHACALDRDFSGSSSTDCGSDGEAVTRALCKCRYGHTALGRGRKFQENITLTVHSMVFEAGYLGDVGLRGQSDHDVQLLQLDINGVVVLHKEHFDLLLQDLRSDEREQNKFFAKRCADMVLQH